jgi:hypothetical protein
MPLRDKKLGLLISASPASPSFHHGIKLAQAALDQGVSVYLYCIDDAVAGLADVKLQALRARGANLFACAYGAQRRDLPYNDLAIFAGLNMVGDLVANTDRFVSFN